MGLQVNPMQLIQMIREGQNPQQLMIGILEKNMASTPMGENLLMLIKQGRTKDIEQIARNLTAQRGGNFDEEFTAFRKQYGL